MRWIIDLKVPSSSIPGPVSTPVTIAVIIAALLATGCGGSANRGKTLPEASSTRSPITVGTDSSGNGNSSSSATSTTSPATAAGSSGTSSSSTYVTGLPPYSYRVGTTGYNSTSITVKARSILKVQFTPGAQDANATGTGFAANYSALGVFITVGSSTQPTPLLYNGFKNTPQQKSDVMDYSSSISTNCASTDTSCRGSVTITISRPNYDYWCINYGTGCPYAQVYSTHPWHGTLEVQTDDTDVLP